jgi:predicted glycosyltransferase
VTTGGGGDGADLVHDVIDAYRADATLTHKALVMLGPYMPAKKRHRLVAKGATVPQIEIREFDNRMEELIAGASAVVSMGGYNTYCEILSFDKPALIVPRVLPREEQLIRAVRARELGLVDMLLPEESADSVRFAQALKALPNRPQPSRTNPDLRLEGLPHISEIVGDWLAARPEQRFSIVEG